VGEEEGPPVVERGSELYGLPKRKELDNRAGERGGRISGKEIGVSRGRFALLPRVMARREERMKGTSSPLRGLHGPVCVSIVKEGVTRIPPEGVPCWTRCCYLK